MAAFAKKLRNPWFALHALFFAFMVSGVFWIPWYVLALVFIALRVQDMIWGGCVLTRLEYGSWDRRYTEDNLSGVVPRRFFWTIPILIDWVFPALIVLSAFLLER